MKRLLLVALLLAPSLALAQLSGPTLLDGTTGAIVGNRPYWQITPSTCTTGTVGGKPADICTITIPPPPAGDTLQTAYNNSAGAVPSILETAGNKGVTLRDAAVPTGLTLFGVQDNAGAVKYVDIAAAQLAFKSGATDGAGVNATVFDTVNAFSAGRPVSFKEAGTEILYLDMGETDTITGGQALLFGKDIPPSTLTGSAAVTFGAQAANPGSLGTWVTFKSGDGGAGQSGGLAFFTAGKGTGAVGGEVAIIGGTSTTTSGGDVYVDGGLKAGGSDGQVFIGTSTEPNTGLAATSAVGIGHSGITTTITGGLTQLTGAVSLTGNGASSFTTSSGALTLTSTASTTWSTSGAGASLTLDANGAALNLGAVNATTVNIGVGTIITKVIGRETIEAQNAGVGAATSQIVPSMHNSATVNQAIEFGSAAATLGALSVTFSPAFNATPSCVCTQAAASTTTCAVDTGTPISSTAVKFLGTGAQVIHWICMGAR